MQQLRQRQTELEKEIAEEKGNAALAQLELDRRTAQESLAIAKRKAAAERDVMLQLGKEITTLLHDKIGGGIQDLFKALREGTLTMENFKEGAKNWGNSTKEEKELEEKFSLRYSWRNSRNTSRSIYCKACRRFNIRSNGWHIWY